jgi:hypothetical protein
LPGAAICAPVTTAEIQALRRTLAVLAALLLATVVAAPADAATTQRTFRGSIGTNGANGTVAIAIFVEGGGAATYALSGMRKSTTYRVEIRNGRCSNLGTVVTRLADIRTNASGGLSTTASVSSTKAGSIMSANWTHRLAVRFVAGSSIRCGNLNFVVASRVRVAAQGVLNRGIDLPIVRGPNGYPYCNVAMYMGHFAQPTEPGVPGVSFIFAHARKGMFLPLLDEWNRNGQTRLVGLTVYVWTSDSRRHEYVITKAWKAKTINMDIAWTEGERLWLQTSTGPNFTYPKLFIQARRVETITVPWSDAHPTARPVKC